MYKDVGTQYICINALHEGRTLCDTWAIFIIHLSGCHGNCLKKRYLTEYSKCQNSFMQNPGVTQDNMCDSSKCFCDCQL